MVSFVNGDNSTETITNGDCYKRRRVNSTSPPTEARTPVQQRQTARHRKQKLKSKLSDSGFEEDLGSSPISSPTLRFVSPVHYDGQLSIWYLQYGDIGFRIQKAKEAQYHPCKSLARQPQLTAEARCKLVSWLIPVHKHLHLSFECCCLAVNIMDRFLASTAVAADCFQLLGITSLLLASKQVEVCSPRISHLLSLCCDAFTKEQLCNLECLILLRLDFRLAAPTLAFFLDFYSNCIEAAQLVTVGGDRFARMNPDTKIPTQCSNLARKVCELSLADYAFNKYPPSLIASCALRLASELLKTEKGFVEHATLQPQQDQWDICVEELFTQAASIQSSASPGVSEDHCQMLKHHFLSMGQESLNHSLAQECGDNLKLLVSLNQDTLEVMSTM
uniref:G2/mitotic-specific cyclin-B2 n=2 Tax=Mastacembelus armatus TaxID=205130 RepID=A0A3Q3LTA2_9TELE